MPASERSGGAAPPRGGAPRGGGRRLRDADHRPGPVGLDSPEGPLGRHGVLVLRDQQVDDARSRAFLRAFGDLASTRARCRHPAPPTWTSSAASGSPSGAQHPAPERCAAISGPDAADRRGGGAPARALHPRGGHPPPRAASGWHRHGGRQHRPAPRRPPGAPGTDTTAPTATTVLLAGATGDLGMRIADALLTRVATGRALVRPSSDAAALQRAATDVDVLVRAVADRASRTSTHPTGGADRAVGPLESAVSRGRRAGRARGARPRAARCAVARARCRRRRGRR